MRIDEADAVEIEAAFAAAQSRTSAPLVCVVAESSADYALEPTLGAAVIALAAPWPLLALTRLPPAQVWLAQLGVFMILMGVLAWAPARAALASRARRRSACFRAAVVQFASRGLSHARERNGVLLYVSRVERYARIVADVGLDVPHEEWRAVIDELGPKLRSGDSKTAFIAAAARIGDLTGQVFPASPGAVAPKSKRFHML